MDPDGSILAEPAELNTFEGTYKVEGIGYDFIPRVIERKYVDKWYKCDDQNSFLNARRLIKEEGMLVGGSSGTALTAALEEAKLLGEGKRMVVILPDSVRNYMTKFISDDWMNECGYIDEKAVLEANTPKLVPNKAWGQEFKVKDMKLVKAKTLSVENTVSEAIDLLRENVID